MNKNFTSIAARPRQESPATARPLWAPTPYNRYGFNEAILAQQQRFLVAERAKDFFPETVYPVIQGRPEQPADFFDNPEFEKPGDNQMEMFPCP